MKKSKLSILIASIALCGVLTMTSCGGGDDTTPDIERLDPFLMTSDLYGLSTQGEGLLSLPYSTLEKTYENGSVRERHAITDVRVLVVPVDFTDYPASETPFGEEGTIEKINDIMFGEASDTGWNSLASYYDSTSFGQCNVTGVVTDWYHTNQSVSEFKNYGAGSNYATQQLVADLQAYFPQTSEDGSLNMDEFDANEDNYIDALVMLYTCPPLVRDRFNQPVDDELYWAYCWQWMGATSSSDDIQFYKFFWASIETFFEGGVWEIDEETGEEEWRDWTEEEITTGIATLDAHTIIHEFGHILGLPDYYTYDDTVGDYHPLGGLDMMAHNVGDHNAFSKALYGWTTPYVVSEESMTITINSTTTTGDFIMLPVGRWASNSTTMLRQYLTIEFITPDGVAVNDGLHQYRGGYPLYYSVPGIRVEHVDARMGIRRSDSQTGAVVFGGYTSNYSPGAAGGYVSFAHDNTKSRSAFEDYRLIELVPATGESIKTYNWANNDCLFQEGDKFNLGEDGVWNNYMVNSTDGTVSTPFEYGFEVLDIDAEAKTATIKITYLNEDTQTA